jgi:Putative beta barrel porin-7 (BBP7)
MNNLRMMLAASLALIGANAIWAQNPPPSDPLNVGPPPVLLAPVPLSATEVPRVVIGDNASSSVPKVWFDLGLGFYWTSPAPMPQPLLTTSDVLDAGILGSPTTVVLSGGQKSSYRTFHSIIFNSGSWFDADRTIGMEGTNVWSEFKVQRGFFASDGTQPLFRPFFDPAIQAQSSVPVAVPDQLAGTFMAEQVMQFNTGDSNLMFNFYRDEERSITGLIGYRYFYMGERMVLTQESTALADGAATLNGTALLAGEGYRIIDRISTVNRAIAGQVGLKFERSVDRFNVALTTKFGIGWQQERIFGDGRTQLLPADPFVAGGFLVQRSFPYRNQQEDFLFISEVGIKASMQLVRRLRLMVGYDFLYFSQVARPGKIVDQVIEMTQNPTSPTFTDMVIHGLTAGVTWQY